MYTVNKYFEYCRKGNIGAIYYCIKVSGVDPYKICFKVDNNQNTYEYFI